MERDHAPWIKLTESKQFSRLLYTNPVCFLTTVSPTNDNQRNVMVISWLTATSNKGTFMCSMNRRRHSASVLISGVSEFVLSVPIKGMESLVRDVGSISGQCGSKFPSDHVGQELPQELQGKETSKRKAKTKRKRIMSTVGIPGLEAEPLQCQVSSKQHDDGSKISSPFAIRGTVAHLKCSTYKIMEDIIDDDHLLILAQVTAASVHSSYWDSNNNTFRPKDGSPPYLTFYGSQEFGYVVLQTKEMNKNAT